MLAMLNTVCLNSLLFVHPYNGWYNIEVDVMAEQLHWIHLIIGVY